MNCAIIVADVLLGIPALAALLSLFLVLRRVGPPLGRKLQGAVAAPERRL